MIEALNPTLHRLLAICRLDRTWVRGDGVWLEDEQGRRFLDCYAQYGAVALGHNAEPVRNAVRAALDAGEPAMVQPYRAPHARALAAELARLAPGGAGALDRCIFTTSGAEAVEAAIKLARARSGRPVVLSAEGSFHGKTLGALAATGQRRHAEGFGPEPPGFERVPFGDADALDERLARDGDRVAALLLEPIQGERGVHPAPPGYLARARAACTRHGVALVLDEIQTGLGRTGRLWACEHEGVVPDILLVAKALGGGLFPLGALLARADWWDPRFALAHSSTFANNNVACRVGLAVLDALERGGVRAAAARQGERLAAGLAALARRHPRAIAEVRGRGLMGAIQLRPPPAEAGSFLSYLSHQGLLAYAIAATIAETAGVLVLPTLGDGDVLRIAPPLVIRDAELDRALDGIGAVCALLERGASDAIARAMGWLDARGRRGRLAAARTPAAEAVVLPPPVARPAGGPCWAFLVHYTRPEDVPVTDPGMRRLSAEELGSWCDAAAEMPPGVVLRVPPIRSAAGAAAEGIVIALPLLPEEMLRRGRKRMEEDIVRAVDLAAHLGARVVGLGGYTTPYSRRGLAVVGRGPAITTGNALTAGMAVAAARRACAERGQPLAERAVAIVGARGSVGALCARLVARERPRRLLLVGNPASGAGALDRLRERIGRAVDVEIAGLDRLETCDLVIAATAAGRPVLDGAPLAAGTIVCDVSRPPDASPALRARADLAIFDGGLVTLPDPDARFGAGNLQGLPDGVQLACLSETIVLALEGDRRDHGVGDEVAPAEADALMALAAKHGFLPAPPFGAAAQTARTGALVACA